MSELVLQCNNDSQFSNSGSRDSQSWICEIDLDMLEARGRESLGHNNGQQYTSPTVDSTGNFQQHNVPEEEAHEVNGDENALDCRENASDGYSVPREDDDEDELLAVVEQLEARYRSERISNSAESNGDITLQEQKQRADEQQQQQQGMEYDTHVSISRRVALNEQVEMGQSISAPSELNDTQQHVPSVSPQANCTPADEQIGSPVHDRKDQGVLQQSTPPNFSAILNSPRVGGHQPSQEQGDDSHHVQVTPCTPTVQIKKEEKQCKSKEMNNQSSNGAETQGLRSVRGKSDARSMATIRRKEKIGQLKFVDTGTGERPLSEKPRNKKPSKVIGEINFAPEPSDLIKQDNANPKKTRQREEKNITSKRCDAEEITSFSPDSQQARSSEREMNEKRRCSPVDDIADFSENSEKLSVQNNPLILSPPTDTNESSSSTPLRKSTSDKSRDSKNKSPTRAKRKIDHGHRAPSKMFKTAQSVDREIQKALDHFGLSTFQRGNLYFQEGHVFQLSESIASHSEGVDTFRIKGKCWGSLVDPYQTEILVKNGIVIRSSCSCPVSQDCKHSCAAFLHWHDCKKNKKPLSRDMSLGFRLFDSLGELQEIKARLAAMEELLGNVATTVASIHEHHKTKGDENKGVDSQREERMDELNDSTRSDGQTMQETEMDVQSETDDHDSSTVRTVPAVVGHKRTREEMELVEERREPENEDEEHEVDSTELPPTKQRVVTFREPLASFGDTSSGMPSPTLTPMTTPPLTMSLLQEPLPSPLDIIGSVAAALHQDDDNMANIQHQGHQHSLDNEEENDPPTSFSLDEDLMEMERALAAAKSLRTNARNMYKM